MKLPWQRQPTRALTMEPSKNPPTGEVRRIAAGEVAHARAEAEREFARLRKDAPDRRREHRET